MAWERTRAGRFFPRAWSWRTASKEVVYWSLEEQWMAGEEGRVPRTTETW